MELNRRIVLSERPRYIIPTVNCFRMDQQPVPAPREGEVLLRTLWLSMDPYLLSKVKRASPQADPVALGDVMVGPTVGRVVSSKHAAYKAGDLVSGFWGWQDYAVSDGTRMRKLPADLKRPSQMLGALGYSGFGAYVALLELGLAKAGETVVIGAATGGLGQIAGQLARLKGIRAVGIAGGPEKCRLATEKFGYAACVDHRSKDFAEALRNACPKGVDVYLELIGGKVFDGVLPLFNLNARMVICGLMAMYAAGGLPPGPDRTMEVMNEVLLKRLQIKGMVTQDFVGRLYHDFKLQMIGWINSGQIKPVEDVVDGLERAPEALQGMFEGRNLGKSLVHVAD